MSTSTSAGTNVESPGRGAAAVVLLMVAVILLLVLLTNRSEPRAGAPNDRAAPSTQRGSTLDLGAAGAIDTVGGLSDPDAQAPFRIHGQELRAEAEIERRLREARVSATFEVTPLRDAIRALCAKAGVLNVWFDESSWGLNGVGDPSVTATFVDETLERALATVLQHQGLEWRIRHEGLIVKATDHKPRAELVTRLYDVGRLRRAFGEAVDRGHVFRSAQADASFATNSDFEPPFAHPPDVAPLIRFLQEETRGPWWDLDGTGGDMTPIGGIFSVRAEENSHRDIRIVLRRLEQFLDRRLPARMVFLHLDEQEHAAECAAWDSLARTIGPLRFEKTPLDEAMAVLSKMAATGIVLERRVLEDDGFKIDAPVTFSADRLTLHSALSMILEPIGLMFVVYEGAVTVTTQVKAEEIRQLTLHDVRDLERAGLPAEPLWSYLKAESRGPWMDDHGTGGEMLMLLPGALVVHQTFANQIDVAAALDRLRRATPRNVAAWGGAFPHPKRTEPLTVRFHVAESPERANEIEQALIRQVAPESWEQAGGRGGIRRIGMMLSIRQTTAIHIRIDVYLRRMKEAEEKSKATRAGAAEPAPAER